MTDLLVIWAVYEHPTDWPDWYVARKHVIEAGHTYPSDHVVMARTLEGVRKMLPPGLHRLPRAESDEPHIVESWI